MKNICVQTRWAPLRNRQRGQSTIELVVTLFAFFTVAFLFVQVALGMGVANYIQYATYMASRAYLSGYSTEQQQRQAAQDVLSKMLSPGGRNRFAGVITVSGDGEVPGATIGASSRSRLRDLTSRKTAWEQGVKFEFQTKLYMIPLIRGAKRGSANFVKLESESWLGRDPTEQECLKYLDFRKSISSPPSGEAFLYDNGC